MAAGDEGDVSKNALIGQLKHPKIIPVSLSF
jgi:hypothetical protein